MTAMAHLTLLLFMLWLGPSTNSAFHRQKRLIGGSTCGRNERRYHVKLRATNITHLSLCGGSLIHKDWILTAAHCWEPGWIMNVTLGVHPGPGVIHQIVHPPEIFMEKDRNNNIRSHDIMLLKLPVSSRITPVALPSNCRRRPPLGASVRMAGYGVTQMGNNNNRIPGESATLQCADLTVVDCSRLQSITHPVRLYQHWFCVQSPGKDTCPGDSGGGMVYQNKIYGVHSFTGDHLRACSEAAGVMDVCSYIDWINNVVGPRKKCPFLQCG